MERLEFKLDECEIIAKAIKVSRKLGHTREEFVMDFMMIAPPAGAVTARVIISPRHMKRVISTLQGNLKKYEDKFGKVTSRSTWERQNRVSHTLDFEVTFANGCWLVFPS